MAQRGGSSHCTTTSSSRREARGHCKCHLEWQALHPDPSSAGCPWHCLSQAIWAPNRVQLEEKRGKKKEKKESKTAASRDQSTAIAQISKLWQDIPRKPFPIKHPGLGEGGWDKEQAGAQVTEPVQALPWLWTSVGKSSMNFSPRQASLLQTASCCITATL